MHANSSKSTAGDITCVACGAQNSDSRKFCSECGDGLWSHCPTCRESISVSEKFCGACGQNLEALYETRLAEFREQVDKAKLIAAEQRFEEAIVALRLTLRNVPELVHAEAQSARPLIEQWEQARDRAFAKAVAVTQRAQAAMGACDYGQAAELIESLHESVLTDDMRSLLAEARGKRKEIRRLRQRIEAAVRDKKGATLMGDLESLVQLTPHDAKSRRLAEQVRDQLCGLANRKFENRQFEDAWSAISRIRDFAANERSRAMAKSIERVCWMHRNLKLASHVDSVLVETATQLSRLSPQDAELTKIQQEVRARMRKAQAQRPVRLSSWDSSEGRQESVLGVPVDYLDWCGAFAGQENLTDEGGPFGTRFVIAAGLALQGVGCASLDIRLGGVDKRGLLGQLSRTFAKATQAAWGLHFGSTALKVLRLEARGKDQPPAITHSGLFPFPDSLSTATSDFERRNFIRHALVEAQSVLALKDDPLMVSLSTVPILARFPNLPKLDKNKLVACIEREANHQIPFPLTDVHWASHVFDESDAAQSLSVLILAMKQSESTVYSELFQTLGLNITAMQSESVALHNLYQFLLDQQVADGKQPSNQPHQTVGLLHAGGEGTQLCLSDRKGIWFRSIPSGGVRVSRSLAIDLKLSGDQAEAAKIAPLKSKDTAAIFRAISQPIGEQIAEVKRTLDVSASGDSSLKPQAFWLSGGAALQHGYVRAFRHGPESIAMGPPVSSRTVQQGSTHDPQID